MMRKKWWARDGVLFELQKKKMNSKTKQHIGIEFWLKLWSIALQSRPCSKRLLVVPCPEECLNRTVICSDWVTATQTFFNHLPKSQFRKTIEDIWAERMQKCILSRSSYFEKDQSKNESVSSKANNIFKSLFSFENCDRSQQSDFTRLAVFCMLLTIESSFHTLLTRFEPIYMNTLQVRVMVLHCSTHADLKFTRQPLYVDLSVNCGLFGTYQRSISNFYQILLKILI